MTWSEFGRRAKENANGGTDHGTANVQFVLGGGVRGGHYGAAPDLNSLDKNGNVKFSIDFRQTYATALCDWFGVDPRPILGGVYTPLPFLVSSQATPTPSPTETPPAGAGSRLYIPTLTRSFRP